MNKIEVLINNLNPLYFEFDKNRNVILSSQNSTKADMYNEFIKLTYYLTKNDIKFFSDDKYNIYLSVKKSILFSIYSKISDLFLNIKRSSNVYILNNEKLSFAKNLPLINIKPIKVDIDVSEYDAIVFTSKNGVIELNKQTDKWKQIESYVIASQTAKKVKELGGKLKFVGKTKHGDSFGYELIEELIGKKVLYVRAKKIVSNIENILLSNNIDLTSVTIYETVCNKLAFDIKIPKNSFIIFSSPSTVKYFFESFKWDETYRAICIGNTTAKYFPNDINYTISDTTSLESCIRKTLN